MDKIKGYIGKYKIVITVILLLFSSLFIYIFASANEDIYENQIEVVDTKVTIIDGQTPFDDNNEAGNDEDDNNKIVRNFDQVNYEISYKLAYKEDSTLDEEDKKLDLTRNVIVDVFIPESLNVSVAETDIMNTQTPDKVLSGDVTYNHYEFDQNGVSLSEESIVNIIIFNINGKNDDIISPIIRVREATDNNQSTTNISDMNKLDVNDVKISAKEDYRVKLYTGSKKIIKENKSTEFPIGIAIYLPKDEEKGIKGIQVPETVEFDLNINADPSEKNEITDVKISNYSDNSGYSISDIPYSYEKNGNAAITNRENNNKELTITFNELSYDMNKTLELTEDEYVNALSIKVLSFTNSREKTLKKDISYSISTSIPSTNTVEVLDNYVPFVGDYTTKIDFFNSNTSYDSTSPTFIDSGKAIYNYAEEFYIQDTIDYGLNLGDKLENGFINYIKIDNDAIQLINLENPNDQSLDYFVKFENDSNTTRDYTIKYGLGDWNSSHFKLKDNRPSYCPSNIATLTKEELMNYYGGPCIEETNINWVDSIQDAIDQNLQNKIIIFKFQVNDEYDVGTRTIINLKAKIKETHTNIGKTFIILSRAQTTYNNKPYYLSQEADNSVENHTSDIRYEKTVYDSSYNITGGNKSYINNNNTITLSGEEKSVTNFGNTILVSPFKASFNKIGLKDSYNSEKSSFYAGITDPIEFIINPVIYKSSYSATITGATVSLYLPEELEIYEQNGNKTYNKTTSGNIVSINGVNYKEYNYDYSESDIAFENESVSGTIPILHVYAYISLATADRTNVTAYTRINASLKPNTDATTVYTDVTPIEQRTQSVNITLRNTKEVNSNGRVNTNLIDSNGTYTYNMRAANSSNEALDLELLYILPYSSDGIGNSSDYNGTISVSLSDTLPSGYRAVYTTDNSKTILNNELSTTSSVDWKEWTDTSSQINSPTAVKIIPTSSITSGSFFGSSSGITLNVITNGNKESDKYYNRFYVMRKNAEVCVDDSLDDCETTERQTTSSSSNISLVSVYNRIISGYVFEDQNYNGFYSDNEPRLKDIAVDLYKLKATNFDATNPVSAISDEDELIDESITNKKGYYEFEGLKAGNYYVKYTFDCDKYTVTSKNKVDPTIEGDASLRDSDAQMIEKQIEEVEISDDEENNESQDEKEENSNVCYAVSNIQTLGNSSNNVRKSNIDLGLRVRQVFDISMKKYINKVVVNSNMGSQTYNYKNQSKVKIDVKNLKNTSFRVTYGIEIENTKYFPGTIGEIVETIPQGMTFNPNLPENDGWYESNGNLYYSYLNKTLIMPSEKYHLTVVLDLVTDNGGDYINFVAANNLKIQEVVTNFFEVKDIDIVTEEEEASE